GHQWCDQRSEKDKGLCREGILQGHEHGLSEALGNSKKSTVESRVKVETGPVVTEKERVDGEASYDTNLKI
ncbi:hypothetical protein TorRG33x02_042060, partial [Trema orientale]